MAEAWTFRVWCECRVDTLARAYRDVLLILATFCGQDDQGRGLSVAIQPNGGSR